MSRRRPILASGLVLIVAVVVSSAAAATVAPSTGDRIAIMRAFGDPPTAAPCLIVRLAASDRRYANVRPRHTQTCTRWAFDGTNVLEHVGGSRWKVLFEGSSYRCPVPRIPRAVQRDLGVCPG
jgi:hypothetical protein